MTTFFIIGDSQAGGLIELGGLVSLLERRGWTSVGTKFVNGGSSERVGQERVAPADITIIAAGGNDPATAQPAWRALAAKAAGKVYWLGPPASSDPSDDERRKIVSNAQRATFQSDGKVQWISGRQLASGLPKRDTVHLTPAGYTSLASRLAGVVPPTSSTPAGGGLFVAGLAVLAGYAAYRLTKSGALGSVGQPPRLPLAEGQRVVSEKHVKPRVTKRRADCPSSIFLRVRDTCLDGRVDCQVLADAYVQNRRVGQAIGYASTKKGLLEIEWASTVNGGKTISLSDGHDYTGCGIGTRMYEAFAEQANDRGLRLASGDNDDLSTQSREFWQKQVSKGRAEKRGSRYLLKSGHTDLSLVRMR